MEVGLAVSWLALSLALLAAGLPLAAALFPGREARGAGLALPAALVVVVLPTYWVGLWRFDAVALLAGVVALLVAVVVALRRGATVDRRAFLEVAVVFTVAFAFLVAVRAADPSAHAGGGEKFLDMGLLQSLLRADHLPPEDAWFAGERVQYYYGGHLVAAVLAKLSGTPGRYAFNLAIATYYAGEVTAVYGLASSLAADRGLSRRGAGVLGAFLFGFAANLLTPFRLLVGALPTGVRAWIRHSTALAPDAVGIAPREFSYWTASRVIPVTINEFPLFTYLNGELHGHNMSPLFFLLAAGVGYAYYRTPADRVWRRRALVLGALPAAGAVVMTINTWSFPAVLGVGWLALTLAPAGPSSLSPAPVARALVPRGAGPLAAVREELQRALVAAVLVGVAGALSLVAVAPFVENVLLAAAGDRHLAAMPTRSGMVALLLVHGAFLAVFALFCYRESGLRRPVLAAVGGVALLAAGTALNLAAVAAVGPVLVGGWYLAVRARDGIPTRFADRPATAPADGGRRGPGYETVLLVAGAGLVVLVEFLYLQDNAGPGRFNTVFKAYAQTWALWSVAGGVALTAVVARADGGLPSPDPTLPDAEAVKAAFLVCLVVCTSVYGVLALAEHAHGAREEPTLDALAFVHDYHPGEAGAVEFFAATPGSPTLAARPTWKVYRWGNPVSSLTGVPTVAGWAHERIYRGPAAYDRRVEDLKLLYNGSRRTRAAMLRTYEVDYVYVGPRERARYAGPFDFASEPGVSVAYRDEEATVYAVNRSALVGAASEP
ncbi:MAG: DUF2298 domain-containing protein [Halobacteriaceae archaeon]